MVRVGSTATRIHASGNASKGYDPVTYPDFVSQGMWAYIRGIFGEPQKLTAPCTPPTGTLLTSPRAVAHHEGLKRPWGRVVSLVPE